MRTTNFDALSTAAPLDRQASVVRDGSGDLFEDKVRDGRQHWSAPPPALATLPRGTENLAGRRVGRFTVVRYHGSIGGSGKWLVRCDCGDYELKKRAKLVRPSPPPAPEPMCTHCDYVRHLREMEGARGGGLPRVRADERRLDAIAAGERP